MDRLSPELKHGLKQEIISWGIDSRAESLMAYLINKGVDPELLIAESLGISKRSYRKEVSDFRTEISDYDNRDYLFLQTQREGLYDSLPENIFHQPSKGKTEKTTRETIQEIRRYKQEQSEARRFFLPFEYGFQHIKVLLCLFEQDFEKHAANSRVIDIFSEQFGILKKLDMASAYQFLRLIPLIHQIRNDFCMVASCLELILGVPFVIENVFVPTKNAVQGASLGNCSLGMDLVTGGWTTDGNCSLKTIIGPLGQEAIKGFISGGNNDLILDELLGYFISADYEVVKELVVEENCREIVLDEGALLGVNSFI